jgi:metal-responsive CopG/Arc/MetJ family transcriptional regulator
MIMQILLNVTDVEGLAITQAAKDEGVSRSEFIRRAVRSGLANAGHAVANGPADSVIVPIIEQKETEVKS